MSWLTRERLTVYSMMIAVGYLVTAIIFHIMARDQVEDGLNPMVTDYNTFYAVSVLLKTDPAAAVYDGKRLKEMEIQVAKENYNNTLTPKQISKIKLYPWLYPPTLLVLLTPLKYMPYMVAYVFWIAVTLAVFLAAVRLAAPDRAAPWVALAFPGIFVTAMFGQNGFLTAGLLGLGLTLLERRPILAGVFFGLLSFKPHFGLLLPLALMVGGYWRVFLSAAVSTGVFALISILAFGFDPWFAFFEGTQATGEILERGITPWTMMPTVFAAVRLSGGSVPLAYALQGIMFTAAVAAVIWAWRAKAAVPGGAPLKAAVLCLATLLATPFGYTYDLLIMALALAWLGWDIHLRGWRKWDVAVMSAAFLLPFASPGIARLVPVQIGPWVILALLAAIIFRMRWRPATDSG